MTNIEMEQRIIELQKTIDELKSFVISKYKPQVTYSISEIDRIEKVNSNLINQLERALKSHIKDGDIEIAIDMAKTIASWAHIFNIQLSQTKNLLSE